MSLGKKATVFLLMVVVMCVDVSMGGGVVYKVGDSAGWTNIANVDYRTWASDKTFHVGDTIVFEYNKEFHNVLRVTHKNYRHCNTTAPIATFNSGNDTFNVRLFGHYYFICGIPGHCEAGQKVDIRVPRLSPALAPAPLAPVVPSPAPTTVPAPSPSHKSGSSMGMGNSKIWFSLLVLAFFV